MNSFHVLTLFPAMFHNFLSESIVYIAQEKEKLEVNLVDFREFSENKHLQVDDYPYGGGAGMVIKPEPLASAIEYVKQTCTDTQTPIVYFTPQGKPLTQSLVRKYLEYPEVILVCGHYKEIDQRIREEYITEEISIGDYVLSGGEIPAMVFVDAVARLLEGVINDLDSALTDSYENGLLGYPCYTRPFDFKGKKVPEVLSSGNHKEIELWRQEKSLEKTLETRPDLYKKYLDTLPKKSVNIYLGLVHYPVYNKSDETITSGITNMDLHDISRTSFTYEVKKFFIIHPNERQKEIFQQITGFWKTEIAAFYNQHRVDALSVIDFAENIDDTVNSIKYQERKEPIIITTTARQSDEQIDFAVAKGLLKTSERPVLILFGTGNGLHESIHARADYILTPIKGRGKYNHLSVRSAVAIILDRLLSEEYTEETWISYK